jgi:hypothetical protein
MLELSVSQDLGCWKIGKSSLTAIKVSQTVSNVIRKEMCIPDVEMVFMYGQPL